MPRHLLAFCVVVGLASCSKQEAPGSPGGSSNSSAAPSVRQSMAYEHFMTLDTEAERVKAIHAQAASMCEQAAAEQCVILASQLETGSVPSANIKLRATPASIDQIMNDLGATARVVAQSLKGEDLATPISDSAKKVQLLGDYRTRLEALGNKAGAELDSLMQLNRELAEVQSQIEALSGERTHLEQRVATQILDLEITASGAISAWTPVSEALANFIGNLADATSMLVTLVAFVLPWVMALALLLWGTRRWRWLRELRRGKNSDRNGVGDDAPLATSG